MKKTRALLGCIILAIFIAFIVVSNKLTKVPPPAPPQAQRGISLNNTVYGAAEEMVADFRNDTRCREQKTAFWLDKTWLDNVCNIITQEDGDGIRIYFARELEDHKPGDKNSIVIVSTFRVRPDTPAESMSDHQDYFDHNNPFFNTSDTLITRTSPTDPGAIMFQKPCQCKPECPLLTASPDNSITCRDAYRAINNCMNGQPINTYSEWFPLSLIKYIDKLKDLTGLRIYYARHDTTTTQNPGHKNRHAFILFPTSDTVYNNIHYNRDMIDCKGILPYYQQKATAGQGGDNGEQCLNNCTGATLPSN